MDEAFPLRVRLREPLELSALVARDDLLEPHLRDEEAEDAFFSCFDDLEQLALLAIDGVHRDRIAALLQLSLQEVLGRSRLGLLRPRSGLTLRVKAGVDVTHKVHARMLHQFGLAEILVDTELVYFLSREGVDDVDLAIKNDVQAIRLLVDLVSIRLQDLLHHGVEMDSAGLSQHREFLLR